MTDASHRPLPDLEGLDAESSTALLRAVFAESPEAIGVSTGPTIQMANPALLRLFGYEREAEVVGRAVVELIAPEARGRIADYIRRRMAGEDLPGLYETHGLRRDGSSFPMHVRTATYSVGAVTHTLTILRDLSREELAIRAVRQSEAFYKALFDVNTAVKLLIEPESGRIVDANRAAIDFYGWPLGTLTSMRITEINQLTDEEVHAEMENAGRGKRKYFRFRHRLAGGEVRNVEVYTGPVDLDGQRLLLSIIHDVSDRDRLEEQLRESQRLEAVGRLAGGIAHDFNNLLTVMMSSADMVMRRSPPESPLRPYLEDLSYAARRAADLTRDLLAFSRRQVLQPEVLDLNDVVRRMQGMLQRTLGPEVQVDSALADGLPAAYADPRLMDQVIMNLALNARDAMPNGGTITLRTGRVRIPEDARTASEPGDWVTIAVRDTGEGMDTETRQRLFEPFFTTKEPGSGSGLGLATVHGIVAQSGGHVTVWSEPAAGSEFVVHLPLAEEGAPRVRSGSEPALRPRQTGVVLLVEDLASVRIALTRGLETAGFEVVAVSTVAEVADMPAAEVERFDAVVGDVSMPEDSGVELAEQLRARQPSLPVLLISGNLQALHGRAIPSGVRFLEKPFTIDRLAKELARMLAAR